MGSGLEGQPPGERNSFLGEDSSIGEAGQGRKYYKRRSPLSGVTAIDGTGGEGETMIEDADGTLSRDYTGIEEPSSKLEERLTSPVSAAGSSVAPITTVALAPSGSGTVSTLSTWRIYIVSYCTCLHAD